MAKQLNVSLAFTADTGKAKAQLQDLQNSLDKLISSTSTNTSNFGLTKELAQATTEASKLKIMLESATNSTGSLDLGKFNQSLKQSGMELKDYAEVLSSLGPEGSKAFAKLAQSITTANVPLRQTNKLLDEFATTMKNTVRWQFSSSMLHGFMGAVSGALGYAKDLDKSLNDIRIVTGYNTDQMAKFAEEANRAAKALSSTTTDYTNASLIYYQQGLGEDEIAKRTEVTMKMANAAGVSAQKVSDQMTAVWNNFDDGSKSLEYYADVMTALGAATASSTDEISAGLNKFASVAETVGLSYEYATAALATVTSTTRESADVVGTAFKTLFARIQGLNLGETLEDGTTLNKYSAALAKVGIDIKDTNGEMKDMNTILDEMGAKWNTLAKDQQTALAQTVAGVRQYTQLVALMNNWDFFKENVKTAETATGALQKQADIYAESWEASSKRVKAAAQGIYDKLIDEDFFIGVNNVLEGTLTQVGNLIDGLGGLPGILSVVSTLMLKAFGKDISESIGRVIYNIKLTSEAGRQEIQKLRKDASQQMSDMTANDGTRTGGAVADVYSKQHQIQDALLNKTEELAASRRELTETETRLAQALMDSTQALGEEYIQQVKNIEASELQEEQLLKKVRRQVNNSKTKDKDTTKVPGQVKELLELQKAYTQVEQLVVKYEKTVKKVFTKGDIATQEEALKSLKKYFEDLEKAMEATNLSSDQLTAAIEKIKNASLETIVDDFQGILTNQEDFGGIILTDLDTALNNLKGHVDEGTLGEIEKMFKDTEGQSARAIQLWANYMNQVAETEGTIKSFAGTIYTTGDSIVAMAEGISALVTGINALKGLGDIWSNEDLTYGEKILSTITTLASIIPIMVSSYQAWNAVKLSGIKNDIAQAAINLKLISQEGIKTGQQAVQNGLLTKEIALEVIKRNLNIHKLAITLALVAAIGALIAGGKILYDNYNKEAIAAKRLADSYKELNEASQEARAEADKLNSTISGYDDAVEKLEACTRGTEEWRDALKEVNEAAIEVIENLPDALPDNMKLTDLYSRDSNGMIVFDRDKLDQVQNSVNLDAESAAYAASAGDVRAQQAQITSDSVDLFRDMVRTQNNMAVAAASSGTTSPVNYVDGRSLVDNLEELSNLPFEEFKNKLEDLGVETAYLTDTALADYQDQINKLAESSEFAAEKLDLITRVKVDDVLGDDYDSETKDIAARDLSSEEEHLRNEYLKKYTGWGINQASGSNNDIYQTILKDLRDAGYDYDAQKNNAVRGNDKNRSFAFLDENGDEVIRTAEWVAETVAASKALQNLEASAEEASTWLGNLDKNASDSTASGVRSVISGGDLSGLTQNEIAQLSNDMGGADGNLTSDEIINYLKTTMGITDDADLAKVFGVNNVGEVATNWLDIISSTNEQFAKIVADLPTAVRGIFEGMDLEKFSLNEQGIIGNLLVDAFENGGTKGAKELESILNSMFTASGEDADDLAKALGGVNWQTTNISELTQILEDAGIETGGFADELAKLISLMQEGQNVGFEAASEHYNTMKDMAKLKEGDSITEEQYKQLEAAGIDASQYFKLMGDGSYELKEAAEEFYQLVNEKSLDVFKSNIEAMYQEIGSVDGVMRRRNEDTIADNNIGTSGGYNQELVSDQLTFLEALNIQLEDLDTYQQIVAEGGTMTREALQEIQTLVEENKGRWDELPASIQASAAELEKHQQALANSASTVDELNRLYEEQFITLEQYQEAVDEVMENEFELEGLDPDAAEEVADAFRDIAEAGAEGMEALKNDEEAVKDATVRYMELNEAITDIYDNYKDYVDVLKAARKASTPIEKANLLNEKSAQSLRKSLAGLLGTTEDLIDADLMAAINPKDFEAAANGNADAIERIREKFIELQYDGLNAIEPLGFGLKELMDELNQFNDGAYIDLDNTEFLNKLIQAAVNAGQTAAEIEAMLSGFGIDADVTPFTEELWKATQDAQAAGQNIANATSFTTEVEQEPVDNVRTTEIPQFSEKVNLIPRRGMNYVTMSNGFARVAFESQYVEAQKSVDTSVQTVEHKDTQTVSGQTVKNGAGASGKGGVIVKNAHKAPAASKAPSAANTSRPPVSSGGGGGGSSKEKEPSKPKKINYTKESDIVERYKEVNDALDNVADSMTRVQMEADILWGKNHINNLKEQNELIEKQIELLDRQYEEAKQYQEKDKIDLGKAASALSVSLVLDSETGDITNIEDAEESIYRQLAAAEEHYNSLATGEEQEVYEETILDPLRQKIEDFETARDLYYDSVETAENTLISKQEAELQKMANNFEMWSEGLEFEITFNENDLEIIEALLNRMEDDVYQMAEAAALMTGIGGEGPGQLGTYLENLEMLDQQLVKLEHLYAEGEITEAAYYDGLEQIKEAMMENVANIQDLDAAMMTYYGDTLVAAGEELARYTDLIDEQNSVLEHYLNLMDLMGKSTNYKEIEVILEGQAEIAENQAKISKEWYEARRTDAANAKAEYEEAIAAGMSDEQVALLKEKWLAAEEVAADAQEKMLSDAEAWAEALRAVLENKLSEIGQTLENELTQGYGSFEAMTNALERANSLQEEYLTTTNQIYETNKLMRAAQQEIDKTSNTAAKRRLKNFIEETAQLQDQTKLSQYELDIQQAKYDLLLAEMALEDAQNAKSTVRLQRDAEGNIGYVYTADQNALSQAEQELEDAQNRLYNIGLEGANEYTEKYQQTLNEMYDTLNDIQQQYLEGSFETEEEYHKAMADAKAYYYEKLQQYSSLYQVAITTDSRVVRDAWTTDFSDMIYKTDEWMQDVTSYVSDVSDAFKAWQEQISGPDGVEQLVGDSLGDISKNVKDVTDKSQELTDKVNNDVIPALNDEIEKVDTLTSEYVTLRESIYNVTQQHINQVKSINEATEAYYRLQAAQNAANKADKDPIVPDQPSITTPSSNYTPSSSNRTSSSDNINQTLSNASIKTQEKSMHQDGTYTGNVSTNVGSTYKTVHGEQYTKVGSYWIKNTDISSKGVFKGGNSSGGTYAVTNIPKYAYYDTGGYTGSWGPYGKLAMLHEKELVLNKEDTENFLASMEILDEILKMIDLQSLNSQIGGLLNSPRLQEIQSQMLEQSVKIEAIFPGVSDRNELEEAFNNLINQASQYANRK